MKVSGSRRHVVLAFVSAVLVLSMLVSSAYIVHEALCHHRCVGEDCPVCRFIAQVGQIYRGLGLALLMLLAMGLALSALRANRGWASAAAVPAGCTLVGRKIRLND